MYVFRVSVNIGKENFGKWLTICQIRQLFFPTKIFLCMVINPYNKFRNQSTHVAINTNMCPIEINHEAQSSKKEVASYVAIWQYLYMNLSLRNNSIFNN